MTTNRSVCKYVCVIDQACSVKVAAIGHVLFCVFMDRDESVFILFEAFSCFVFRHHRQKETNSLSCLKHTLAEVTNKNLGESASEIVFLAGTQQAILSG